MAVSGLARVVASLRGSALAKLCDDEGLFEAVGGHGSSERSRTDSQVSPAAWPPSPRRSPDATVVLDPGGRRSVDPVRPYAYATAHSNAAFAAAGCRI